MNRKVLSVSLICTMLTASFVLVSMTVVKSKPKHIAGSSQTQPDPPGTIYGSTNPELISDHVAWSVVLGVIAKQKTPEEKKRIRAYIRMLGLGRAKGQGSPGASAPDPEDDIDKLIGVAKEYETERDALDTAVGFTAATHVSLSAEERTARAGKLKKQKEQLVAGKVSHLSRSLTPAGYLALVSSLGKVKRGIKIITYDSMPPSK
jgi:hypothetical protein